MITSTVRQVYYTHTSNLEIIAASGRGSPLDSNSLFTKPLVLGIKIMGSPNFSHDSILNTTFGYSQTDDCESYYQDDLIDCISSRLDGVGKNLFMPVISIGYHNGFVIHTEGVSGNYQQGTDDKEYILDQMHGLIKEQLSDRDLLKSFMNGTADSIIREYDNDDIEYEYTPRSVEFLYILEVLSNAADIYEQFTWILDDHMEPLLLALEQSGVKITDATDVETLYCDIDAALDPKAIREAVSDCIEADIARLEQEITDIAEEYKLQHLVGSTWTSHLKDYDYNPQESEPIQAH